MIVKQHINQGRILLTICDDEVIGKKLEEGKKQLDLSADFFKGERKTEEEVKQLIKKAVFLNLNGEKAVALGVELGFVDPENILFISNVPHAECVVFIE